MLPFALMANQAPRIIAIETGEGDGGSTPTLDVSGMELSENDVLVIFFAVADTGANETFNMTGFTQVADLYQSDTYETNLHVGYKVQTSSPDSTVTIGPAGMSASDSWSVVAFNVRGINATTLDVAATTVTTGNTLLINPPAITPVTNGSIIISGGTSADNGFVTYTSGDLNDFQSFTGDQGSSRCHLAVGWAEGTTSEFDPAEFGASTSDNSASSVCACTLALRPR